MVSNHKFGWTAFSAFLFFFLGGGGGGGVVIGM